MGAVRSMVKRWAKRFRSFVRSNLNNFANLLILIVPFLSLAAGMWPDFKFNASIVFPIAGVILICLLKALSSILGRGYDIPVPLHRFTHIEPSGEVWMPQSRIQEMLLYVADLEDWLERNGYFDDAEETEK